MEQVPSLVIGIQFKATLQIFLIVLSLMPQLLQDS